MSWTDERVETLKKMWTEGQSASQIAKELGGVTRNAVIGKVHRLGLSNRVGPAAGHEARPGEAGDGQAATVADPAPPSRPAPAPRVEPR
ncbi:MAG: GcrA cell cycle regulator, partial [Alphaproteobacteria bacterium HGW-Alphaproteobacteria-6]